jgi:hypothetical protein
MTYTIDEVFEALEQARRVQYEAAQRAEYLEVLARKMLQDRIPSVESLEDSWASVTHGGWEGMSYVHASFQGGVQRPAVYH